MPAEAIAGVSTTQLIAKLASAFAEPAKGTAQKTKEKLEVKFSKGFSRFLEENLARFSTVKTIISSSTPIPLIDIYVNLHLADAGHATRAHRDEDFIKQIERYKYVLFTATAGAGKSMLMRYLYLRFLEAQTDRLPVFIELRELNQNPSMTLLEYARKKIEEYLAGFSDQQLRYALETGRIVFFLDGFDEVDHDKRKERERQINDLAARFQKLQMFVSSRPAETFASWEKFHVFRVQPFAKNQVELLISKIKYDEEIKALFRKKLSEGLYETHKEFLTNPLLTIMMLITLEQFAEVPAKIHLFYEYAFEALFGRHDVTKGGFQRKRHTTLALDDFKRLFAYFSMVSYLRELQTFSSDKVLELIQISIDSSQIEVDKSLFLNDLTESTCMLIQGGLDYTFSHRSFQEYFAAYFLSRIKVDEFQRALPKLVQRSAFDSVLKMVSEMNKEKFEETWALPTARLLCDRIKGIDARRHCMKVAIRLIGGEPRLLIGRRPPKLPDGRDEADARFRVSFRRDETEKPGGRKDRNVSHLRVALYRVYGFFDRIQSQLKDLTIEDENILKKIADNELLKDDLRFRKIRGELKRDQEAMIEIPLNERDSEWLKDAFFGRFIQTESELLPKLRDEIAHRVAQRKRGLSAIFPGR